MRFATIAMVLASAIFAAFAASAFLLPEPQMPGVTNEAEFTRGGVTAARSAWGLSGATRPGHDVFLRAYYVCLTAFAVAAMRSTLAARKFASCNGALIITGRGASAARSSSKSKGVSLERPLNAARRGM